MRLPRMLLMISTLLVALSSAALAADFDWVKDFNIKAEADPSGFRARLAARFKIGDTEIHAVLSTCEKSADAYIVLRLGEMSKQPTEYVIEKYKVDKGKGWGRSPRALASSPGQRSFTP